MWADGVRCAQSVSQHAPGQANIDDEILPPQNPLVVVHDSMGFEPGKPENLDRAENFVKARTGADVPLKEQVHIIWCVANSIS
jgi:hypothetical protein